MPSPSRVLVVYGSETGNARRGILKCVDTWQAKSDGSFTVRTEDVMDGNSAKEKYSVAEMAKNFDVSADTKNLPNSTHATHRFHTRYSPLPFLFGSP